MLLEVTDGYLPFLGGHDHSRAEHWARKRLSNPFAWGTNIDYLPIRNLTALANAKLPALILSLTASARKSLLELRSDLFGEDSGSRGSGCFGSVFCLPVSGVVNSGVFLLGVSIFCFIWFAVPSWTI